ncbi:unnamed protein product [Onchocerca ochengi]|uniref:Protein quiver n=1 Tax=Onchocerca ochengi TaxID=42157 RepID=A0A182EKR5_ONCOC|nr:unnamed protein product [Onchocerca ochengi]
MRPNRCYSCMSPLYEEFFKDGSMSRYLITTTTLINEGRNTGKKLTIRGCAVSISRNGFFSGTMVLFDRYDMCRDVKASDLFRYESDSQTIRVCSCLGDRCNVSASYYEATYQLVIAAIIFVFFIPKLF